MSDNEYPGWPPRHPTEEDLRSGALFRCATVHVGPTELRIIMSKAIPLSPGNPPMLSVMSIENVDLGVMKSRSATHLGATYVGYERDDRTAELEAEAVRTAKELQAKFVREAKRWVEQFETLPEPTIERTPQ